MNVLDLLLEVVRMLAEIPIEELREMFRAVFLVIKRGVALVFSEIRRRFLQ